MRPKFLDQIEELFAAAIELDQDLRATYLKRACGGDEEVRREVESLLRARREAGSYLEEPLFGAPGQAVRGGLLGLMANNVVTTPTDDGPLVPAERCGSYRILRKLGSGGMGSVYLATRDDAEYRRQVAIKVVRPSIVTAELIRRFRVERQILALLDHPHIARLYDGGTTQRGLPYYVMEYVEGKPLDDYCKDRRLTIEQRLRLFRLVCSAVHYAHHNLVVHRDLKPSNILVTPSAEPKLLDFGISKLLVSDPRTTPPEGLPQMRPMTPVYASPEQVLGQRPITTAVDIYALGVLLFELLTGSLPYLLVDGSLAEVRRALTEQEPRKPSEAVTEDSALPRRQLTGDLDSIVVKALRKNPAERYGSAEDLSADLQRYLAGYPVLARPASLAYRSGKFVRRNRALVALAAALFLGVFGFAVAMAVQATRLTVERDISMQERRKAQYTLDFLVDIFARSDPDHARGHTVTAREILDEGSKRIEEELGEEPETRATLMHTMGVVYSQLGLYSTAEPLVEEAFRARRQTLGVHPDTAESLMALAALQRDQGDFPSAELFYGEALRLRRRVFGEQHAAVADTLNELGRLLHLRGDYKAAETRLLEALALRRQLLGDRHEDFAISLNDLAVLRTSQGDYREAETLFRQALDVQRRRLGGVHSAVTKALINVAATLTYQADYDEAESLYREALDLQRRLTGHRHPIVAACLHNLASLLQIRGSFEEGRSLFEEALALRRELLGEDHPLVASTLNRLASLLWTVGDRQGAELLFRQALAIRRRVLGDEHPSVAESLNNLGTVRMHEDRKEAEQLFREALALNRRHLGDEHPEVAAVLNNLANLLCRRDSFAEGEELVREALEIYRQSLPADHWRISQARVVLGSCLVGLGRFREAQSHIEGALTSLRQTMGPSFRATQRAQERLADLFEKSGKPEAAKKIRAELVEKSPD